MAAQNASSGGRKLVAPPEFNRNSKRIRKLDPDETGALMIDQALTALGLDDLSNSSVLDVGCGVRFTQTIINRGLPLKSYTGVDVEPKLIKWLKHNVSDSRFTYAHWKVRNAMYNKRGKPFTRESRLPVDGKFDVIWLFSVMTHLSPDDTDAMLAVLRRHVAPEGRLLFTAIIDDEVDGFVDRVPDKPLLNAVFSNAYMTQLIEKNGWRVERVIPKQPENFVNQQYLCRPA